MHPRRRCPSSDTVVLAQVQLTAVATSCSLPLSSSKVPCHMPLRRLHRCRSCAPARLNAVLFRLCAASCCRCRCRCNATSVCLSVNPTKTAGAAVTDTAALDEPFVARPHKRAYRRSVRPAAHVDGGRGASTAAASGVGDADDDGDVEPIRQRQVSGPVFFGFGLPQVQQAIQQMPGAAPLLCNIDAKYTVFEGKKTLKTTKVPMPVGANLVIESFGTLPPPGPLVMEAFVFPCFRRVVALGCRHCRHGRRCRAARAV